MTSFPRASGSFLMPHPLLLFIAPFFSPFFCVYTVDVWTKLGWCGSSRLLPHTSLRVSLFCDRQKNILDGCCLPFYFCSLSFFFSFFFFFIDMKIEAQCNPTSSLQICVTKKLIDFVTVPATTKETKKFLPFFFSCNWWQQRSNIVSCACYIYI